MKRLLTTTYLLIAVALLISFPQVNAGSRTYRGVSATPAGEDLLKEADHVQQLYDSIKLDRHGLSKEAFKLALKGYKQLLAKGQVKKKGLITICDFSQSSSRKRLFLVNIEEYQLLMQTYVAHGKKSGSEYATRFSNLPESHQSSLGFYLTRNTYHGEHGLSLVIDGVEKGINDKAVRRHIVVHGCDYVGDDYRQRSAMMGRSFGCPAVPREDARELIETIKEGSVMFIYHPSTKYIAGSKILNG